ncbi:FAD-dependent monooxygenase [Streptomyces agglomeratus]|uniref:FAD-dependent monooxygenase n=1 Tax=Streptomyces agglomeratus TaxID=285458 RepID=UPI000A74FF46|nr:FAD-dependent monooxygenase [Streptomyces agglomeratus]
MAASRSLDVLVVGAGPTGLALAAQLHAYGARFRIVDRHLDRARESRALAIQPRTLEALAPFGVTDELIARGNPAVQLRMHLPGRTVRLPLFDLGVADTPYPFLLFLSQAETESVLCGHLDEAGTTVERGTELLELTTAGAYVACRLRHRDGTEENVNARYVVGCDGAHSTVRSQAGIGFEGHAYPQTFLLADLEVDGLERGAAHAYMTEAGMLFFFPLGSPASWRLLAMRPPGGPDTEGPVELRQLQALVDRYVNDPLHLRDPVWMTDFRIHNRGAKRYRADRVFLAGDAAHIHSPAGAQGMNTGIQDSLNLGWKSPSSADVRHRRHSLSRTRANAPRSAGTYCGSPIAHSPSPPAATHCSAWLAPESRPVSHRWSCAFRTCVAPSSVRCPSWLSITGAAPPRQRASIGPSAAHGQATGSPTLPATCTR